MWQQQIDALSDVADCTVADYGTLDSLPAMAEAVLSTAPEQFSVAGHSMGGRVALEIYHRAPDRVARIALLNTGAAPLAAGSAGKGETRKRSELVAIAKSEGMRAMVRVWLPPMIDARRINDAALVEAITEMMSRKTPEIFAAQIHALLGRPDATDVLGEIHCPALLLTGREDGWSGVAQHRAMAHKIADSQLVIVPECGHMSTMERPAQVSAAMRAWLLQPV